MDPQGTNPTDQKTFHDAVGSPTPAPVTPGNPTDNGGDKPPVEPKPEAPPNPAEPPDTEHDWKTRFDNASKASRELREDYERTVSSNAKLVQKNPELLDDIANDDPKLANAIAKKVHGVDSYQEYKKTRELEVIRDSDPSRYETESRLRKLEDQSRKRQTQIKESFYQTKGIPINEYDQNYQKIEQQFDLLNKEFVEENPERAFEIAYSLAFPQGKTDEEEARRKAALAANTTPKGGNMGSNYTPGSPAKRPRSQESQAFHDQFSRLTAKPT